MINRNTLNRLKINGIFIVLTATIFLFSSCEDIFDGDDPNNNGNKTELYLTGKDALDFPNIFLGWNKPNQDTEINMISVKPYNAGNTSITGYCINTPSDAKAEYKITINLKQTIEKNAGSSSSVVWGTGYFKLTANEGKTLGALDNKNIKEIECISKITSPYDNYEASITPAYEMNSHVSYPEGYEFLPDVSRSKIGKVLTHLQKFMNLESFDVYTNGKNETMDVTGAELMSKIDDFYYTADSITTSGTTDFELVKILINGQYAFAPVP